MVKIGAATLGPGFGGKIEFAVEGNNILTFIRYTYVILRNNNFAYTHIFDELAFKRFSVLCYEMAKKGPVEAASAAGAYAFGMTAMAVLRGIEKLVDTWTRADDKQETANNLIAFVKKNHDLLKLMVPEVKGRILFQLCAGESLWMKAIPSIGGVLDIDKPREEAILAVLKTIVSKNEYRNVLDNMGLESPPPKSGMTPEQLEKRDHDLATLRNQREKVLEDILDNAQQNEYDLWRRGLPEVAPVIK